MICKGEGAKRKGLPMSSRDATRAHPRGQKDDHKLCVSKGRVTCRKEHPFFIFQVSGRALFGVGRYTGTLYIHLDEFRNMPKFTF